VDRRCGARLMASVEFFGESYGLNAGMSEFALMEFAEAADSGIEQNGMAAMAAMLRLIKTCIVEADLQRFLASARKNRPTSDDLIAVLDAAANQVTERPTSLPADSSAGQTIIAPSVASSSADKGLDLLRGRPDLQLAVLHTRAG